MKQETKDMYTQMLPGNYTYEEVDKALRQLKGHWTHENKLYRDVLQYDKMKSIFYQIGFSDKDNNLTRKWTASQWIKHYKDIPHFKDKIKTLIEFGNETKLLDMNKRLQDNVETMAWRVNPSLADKIRKLNNSEFMKNWFKGVYDKDIIEKYNPELVLQETERQKGIVRGKTNDFIKELEEYDNFGGINE